MPRPNTKKTPRTPESTPMERLVNKLEQLAAGSSELFPNGVEEFTFEYEAKGERVKLYLRGMPERSLKTNILAKPAPEKLEGTDDYKYKWNMPGHAVIAKLAEDLLNDESQATYQALTGIMNADPREGRDELAKYATWPDEMKSDPAFKRKTGNWHYIDIQFTPGVNTRGTLPAAPHVLSAMKEQLRLLAQSTNPEERADALAFVTHLVGDIHQPLHCIELVDAEHPQGDGGGNKLELTHGKNLHSLWDGLVATNVTNLGANAETLKARFPKQKLKKQLEETNIENWVWESHEIGREAYERILEEPVEQRASKEYRDWARETARERAALAAYRLAALLADTLK